jgi:hypothetical protein
VPAPEATPLPAEEPIPDWRLVPIAVDDPVPAAAPTADDMLVDELAPVAVAEPAEAPIAAAVLAPTADAVPEPAA